MRIIHSLTVCVAFLIAALPASPAHAGDRVSSCGGAGERACCVDEAFPSCDGDNVETSTPGGACGGPLSGLFGAQAGTCILNPQNPNNNTECGGEGQRACCIGEASPSCDTGLLELNPPGGTGLLCPGSTLAAGVCFAPTACGAPGQRACCTTERGPGTPACNDDAAPLSGGIGATEYCGDATNAFLGLVPGSTCVAVTECGGIGQRACCSVPAETLALGKATCVEGGVELLGVTGDATCTDNIATTGAALGTCITAGPEIPVNESGTIEPTTNWSPATTAPLPQGSLRGFADMHLHVLAHLAHGKEILAGYPAPVGPDGHILPNAAPSAATALSPLDDAAKHFTAIHPPLGDTVGFGTKDSTLSHFGWPYFNGWPSWNSTTHQQVYYKWLERAWRGGMRLTTMLAVTNEAMCKSNNTYGTPKYAECDTSMTSILEQLQTVWDFQAFIDNQSGGPGKGWFRIVTTPEQAKDVIRAGKLAVVLGIEVDNLFGCKESGCPKVTRKDANGNVILGADGKPVLFDMDIEAEVDKIYALGVRHVFPVHNFDNAFGAAATWQDIIAVGQAVSEGRYWKVRNCRDENYGFSLSNLIVVLSGAIGFNSAALPQADLPSNVGSGGATCNQYGLYSQRLPGDQRLGNGGLGPQLINALMNRGMIIDIDHMSTRALDETIAIARQRWAEYPLVASHVQFFDRHVQDFQAAPDLNEFGGGNAGRHERMRTAAQLAAIRDGGGMVAAMLKDDAQDGGTAGKQVTIGYQPQQPGAAAVPNNCVHSSKSFAQSYQFAVDTMQGPVAFGSDFNGIAAHIGPRFGSEACAATFDNPNKTAERLAQETENNRVPYPFEVPGFGTLDRQVTGLKTFDYNTDGMAHVGLVPDFIKDLSQIGMSKEYIDSIFCSAERYIQVWERGIAISSGEGTTLPDYSQMTCNRDVAVGDTTPPVSSASAAPAPTAAGWNNSAVTVTVTAADEAGGSGLQMIAYAASGASNFADSSPTSPALVNVINEGTSSVAYYSRDVAGNIEAKKSLQVRIDGTPPTIVGSRTPAANAAGWNNAGVTASFLCADALSGVATCSLPQSFTTEGAGRAASGAAIDKAGNSASTTVTGINIDLTAPTITAAATPLPNGAGWNNSDVTVSFTCADALSGIASCTAPATLASDGINLGASGTATDNAGNSAATSIIGIRLDKTKPVVTVTGVQDGASYTFGSVPVAGCTTTDALSGVANAATINVTGGTSNGVGSFTATCNGALDVAGNANATSVTYRVRYDFRGFFSPVDNLPTLNAVTAGQAVPIKFSLGGDFGLDILASNSPVSVSIQCLSGVLVDDIEETVTAGSSALTYSGGQYVYVWKTTKSWANSCRAFQLKLDDDTTHSVNFRFR